MEDPSSQPLTKERQDRPATAVDSDHVKAFVKAIGGTVEAAAYLKRSQSLLQHAVRVGFCSPSLSVACRDATLAIKADTAAKFEPPKLPPAEPEIAPADDGDALCMVSVPPAKMPKFRQAMAFLGLRFLEN